MEQKENDIKKTILVAEDVESNFLLLKALLRSRYNLLWAKTGTEAVKMFKNEMPDIILMDIKMPEMDGLEATRLVRSYSKDIPIIALTAYVFDSDKEKALEAGCNGFLAKPISYTELQKVLDSYLGSVKGL